MASRKRNHSGQKTKIFSVAIGLIIILTFSITLIAPGRGGSSSSNTDVTYNTPVPVAPPPDLDPQFEGEPPYIHSSGYFRVFRPAGADWTISEASPMETNVLARVYFNSPSRFVVIHNYIQPGVEYETLASLSENFLTSTHFAGAWRDYDSWTETGREVTETHVTTEFTLAVGGVDYVARATNWLVEDMLYAVRVVVPDNNPLLLDLLHGYAVDGFVAFPEFQAMDEEWPAFPDQELGYAIKYP
ncbi:MAG: hypothetical protein K8S97_03815, partial [Anaerolineae bacterium]|nr:hypothetical protein [Anaerolineae bacterium]